jgi:hypothetical protein
MDAHWSHGGVFAFDSLEVAEHGGHLTFKLVYFLFGGRGRDGGFPNPGLTVDRRLDEAESEQSYRVGTDSTAVVSFKRYQMQAISACSV